MAGRSAQEGFNRFVEGNDSHAKRSAAPLDESRKDFWDDFASLAEQKKQTNNSSIGTSAMGMGKRTNASGKKQDDWDDW